ncbi:MAG: DUF1801 domain-containing protein [Polaribacter sp.]|jgi:predicted metal-dependent RNase|nr:DUF1801 domain-containing protein [Polaribacter sp.]MDG1953794.1 DUF1801 domain-containing protein [Polaribacter sp.]MDG2073029.1 DUF1801 domain-containing protein [Polaribacter sp.]
MKPAEEYILSRPEPFKSILLHVQLLIESTYSNAELRYKWKIPVYYIDKNPFCYLNASLKKGYVDVCFWASAHLKYNEHLVTEGRKVVKSLRYFKIEDINEEVLFSVLEEAYKSKEKGFYKK